jgi:hypothetical protein
MMTDDDSTKQLTELTRRADVPEDARNIIASTIQDLRTPLHMDIWIYRSVVAVLGLTLLSTVFGGLALAIIGQGDATIKLPDSIVAIGSAAVGALAGLLAPSPVART